jgi:PAS domain S-box-containing protein
MRTTERNDGLSQQDLRVLLDNAPDAIARFDRDLRHVYVNEATAKENGRPAGDFLGKTMQDIGHPPEVSKQINDNLRAVFASGKECVCELLFQGPHGPRWFQCRMAPEFDAAGEVEFALVISRDMTEHRKAERHAQEAARESSRAKLIARLAHEINNPLFAVLNSVYLLQHKQQLNAEGRELLQLAAENIERVSQISKEILSLEDRENGAADDERLALP